MWDGQKYRVPSLYKLEFFIWDDEIMKENWREGEQNVILFLSLQNQTNEIQ